MKKRIISVICILAVIFLAIYFIPLPVHVNQTFRCTKFYDKRPGSKNPSDDFEITEITVDGWYFRYLLKDNTFNGQITIPELYYTEADNGFLMKTTFSKSSYNSTSLMYYDKITNRITSAGSLYVKGNFEHILMSSGDDTYIAGPADDREAAIEIANDVVPIFKFE